MIMDSQVSGLSKLRLEKLVNSPNLDKENYAKKVTCTIIVNILHTAQNSVHIAHIIIHITQNVVHTIYLYAMRSWNHGLNIKTSQNEGSTYGTSTREPSLANT